MCVCVVGSSGVRNVAQIPSKQVRKEVPWSKCHKTSRRLLSLSKLVIHSRPSAAEQGIKPPTLCPLLLVPASVRLLCDPSTPQVDPQSRAPVGALIDRLGLS